MFCADAFFRASHLKLLTYSYVMWSHLALVVALLAYFDDSCVHRHIGKQICGRHSVPA